MNKHIVLFKEIPCGNFGPSKLFFDEFKIKNIKDISTEDILMAYYYIAEEMMDSVDSGVFIIRRNNPPFHKYDCHDPLTHEQKSIYEYKKTRFLNGVMKGFYNRTPKSKQYGLIPKPKTKVDSINHIIEDFRIYASLYKSKYFHKDMFTNKKLCTTYNQELDHLYILLQTLNEKASFSYKQPGSIILAQELANTMINQNIVMQNMHMPNKIDFIHQHKLLMFGELRKQY